MTAIGRFSLVSQTRNNPSVAAFLITLTGNKPLTKNDFLNVWNQHANMSQRHPRFHQVISRHQPGYFERKKDKDDQADPAEEHVAEVMPPKIYRKDVQHRLEHLLTSPFDVHKQLWEALIAPFAPLGTSGGISRQQQRQIEQDNTNVGESLLLMRAHY